MDTSRPAAERSPLTLAVFQCQSQPLDVAANLQRMEQVAREARAQGADIVLFPEMFVTGYNIGPSSARSLAQSADGAYCNAVAQMARTAGIAIVFGYPELDGAGHVFNAAQWIDKDGQVVLNYRKTHLYGDLDRSQFTAGEVDASSSSHAVPRDVAQSKPVPSALGTLNGWHIGLLICYDVEFPENTRRLGLAGADCVLVPTANMDTYDFVPDTLVPTRAFENQMVLAYANYCGPEGNLRYGGLSSITGALGQPLAKAGREEALLLATLLPGDLQNARHQQTHLQELRAYSHAKRA